MIAASTRGGESGSAYALWLFYSSAAGTSSHAHFDALNFGLYTFDQPVVCEQGYPLYTGGWPARWDWTSNTRSHATVTVDDACQKHCSGGKLLAFAEKDGIRLVAAEAPSVSAEASAFLRRFFALLDSVLELFPLVDSSPPNVCVMLALAGCAGSAESMLTTRGGSTRPSHSRTTSS